MQKLCEGLNELDRDEARRIYEQRLAAMREKNMDSQSAFSSYYEPADSDWLDNMQQGDYESLMGGPEDPAIDDYY